MAVWTLVLACNRLTSDTAVSPELNTYAQITIFKGHY